MQKQTENNGLTTETKQYIKNIKNLKKAKHLKTKKLSGYNIFCKEASANTKMETDTMKQIGKSWRKISQKEKEVYKNKANVFTLENSKNSEMHVTRVQSDPLVLELQKQIEEVIKNFKKNLKINVKETVEETVEETVPETKLKKIRKG